MRTARCYHRRTREGYEEWNVQPEPHTLVHFHDGILRASVTCPDCGAPGEKDIKLYNWTKNATYRLGDVYPGALRHVGRGGWIRGRAYCNAEFARCFAVKVFVQGGAPYRGAVQEGGVLVRVAVDSHQYDAAEDLH